jgi:hypothetical protein
MYHQFNIQQLYVLFYFILLVPIHIGMTSIKSNFGWSLSTRSLTDHTTEFFAFRSITRYDKIHILTSLAPWHSLNSGRNVILEIRPSDVTNFAETHFQLTTKSADVSSVKACCFRVFVLFFFQYRTKTNFWTIFTRFISRGTLKLEHFWLTGKDIRPLHHDMA